MNCHDLGRWFESECKTFCKSKGQLWFETKTKQTQELFGDFITTGAISVEAKAELKASDNFPFELMQCVDLGEPGWSMNLKQCDEMWYHQYEKLESWKLDFRKLMQIPISEFETRFSNKGHGKTKLKIVPFEYLIRNKIAQPFSELTSWIEGRLAANQ